MWIENVPRSAIQSRLHHDAGPNSVLIQIGNLCSTFPIPKHNFKEVYQFEFLDIDDDDILAGRFPEDVAISNEQAVEIATILNRALSGNSNVVVHCHVGICRSGAVAEVGSMIGFTDVGNFKIPNTRVKRLLMKALNIDCNAESSAFNLE